MSGQMRTKMGMKMRRKMKSMKAEAKGMLNLLVTLLLQAGLSRTTSWIEVMKNRCVNMATNVSGLLSIPFSI
jgi:hypothetical protein